MQTREKTSQALIVDGDAGYMVAYIPTSLIDHSEPSRLQVYLHCASVGGVARLEEELSVSLWMTEKQLDELINLANYVKAEVAAAREHE